jgi:hypothetical protein
LNDFAGRPYAAPWITKIIQGVMAPVNSTALEGVVMKAKLLVLTRLFGIFAALISAAIIMLANVQARAASITYNLIPVIFTDATFPAGTQNAHGHNHNRWNHNVLDHPISVYI